MEENDIASSIEREKAVDEILYTMQRMRRRFSKNEAPPMEWLRLPVLVWDPDRPGWEEGRMVDATLIKELVTLTWASITQNTTDNAPDEDEKIDITYAKTIAVQADTTATGNVSSDLDVNVEVTLDGLNWDTVPYAEMNIGDNALKTMIVTPAGRKMRLRVDENNSGAGAVTCRILIRE